MVHKTVTHMVLQDLQIAYILLNTDLQVCTIGGDVGLLRTGLAFIPDIQEKTLEQFLASRQDIASLDAVNGDNEDVSLERTLVASPQNAQPQTISLWDIAPEFIGYETEVEEILAGTLPRLQLSLVERDSTVAHTPETPTNYYISLTNLPYTNQSGQVVGILHYMENITSLGQMEQTLTQQRNESWLLRDRLDRQNAALEDVNKELKRLDELKSRFLSVAAHELRSPLASIYGFVELMFEDDFGSINDDQKQFLEIIQRSTQRLQSLTSNLLDITRIETGRVELDLRPLSALDLVEQVANELHPQLELKKQTIFFDVNANIERVLCDEARLVQILHNLVSNAIKYTHENGQITLTLKMLTELPEAVLPVEDTTVAPSQPPAISISPDSLPTPTQEHVYVLFAIQDNGIGISLDDQSHLFSSFFRASNVHLTQASGSGLGLQITKSLVELHGGHLWFESTEGVGTTFFVAIPAA
ncbi:MAG: HAMP domain-containing sensor histidine kinase [Chloroflexota bacterium]